MPDTLFSDIKILNPVFWAFPSMYLFILFDPDELFWLRYFVTPSRAEFFFTSQFENSSLLVAELSPFVLTDMIHVFGLALSLFCVFQG